MALISLNDVSFGYGGPALVENIQLRIEQGERICLAGRNGTGKSTLLKLLQGELLPNEGDIRRQPGLRVARLLQEVPSQGDGTVFELVASGFAEAPTPGEVRAASERSIDQLLAESASRSDSPLPVNESWEVEQRVEQVLARMQLAGDVPFSTLSSGMKRRVLLARALVNDPDMLLLDEPTNHLDIEAIDWLENFLLRFPGTLVFVTHDRMFLQKLATRILEIDRGRLFDWTCDYPTFLKRKEATLEAEAQQQALFDKKLAEEEAWIRQGIKARRTRNEGRVRALKKLREQRRARREQVGKVRVDIQETERSGNLVIEAKNLAFQYDDQPIINDFSTTIVRGDKIGIIGPNGCGKSTLLRLLLGQRAPQSGSVRHGTNLQIAYFDQLRAQLDEDLTVVENVGQGTDTLLINGSRRHIMGYLQDFLFSPERARSPVRTLSGGERNRVLLARLFTQPSNLLVLDEPTNDLDAETLELLEELLLEYPGTVLLVSHDRAFLNNVVTSTIVFETDEERRTIREYAGGYDDWLIQRTASQSAVKSDKSTDKRKADKSSAKSKSAPPARPRKLSFNEQRELEALPERIESLEAEKEELVQTMSDPAFYQQQEGAKIGEFKQRLEQLEEELQTVYARWEELEERQNAG